MGEGDRRWCRSRADARQHLTDAYCRVPDQLDAASTDRTRLAKCWPNGIGICTVSVGRSTREQRENPIRRNVPPGEPHFQDTQSTCSDNLGLPSQYPSQPENPKLCKKEHFFQCSDSVVSLGRWAAIAMATKVDSEHPSPPLTKAPFWIDSDTVMFTQNIAHSSSATPAPNGEQLR